MHSDLYLILLIYPFLPLLFGNHNFVFYTCESIFILYIDSVVVFLYSEYIYILDCKEIEPVHSKGDQPWDFCGRNDAEAETPVLWPRHVNSWLIGKDSDPGRDCGQEEKGTTEDEMAEWHHQLDGHEFGWILGVGDGQGGLVCCDSWGCKESDTTERLNWTELMQRESLVLIRVRAVDTA